MDHMVYAWGNREICDWTQSKMDSISIGMRVCCNLVDICISNEYAVSIVSAPDILQKKFIVQILHILSQFIAIYMGYMIKYIYNFLCLTEEMYFL